MKLKPIKLDVFYCLDRNVDRLVYSSAVRQRDFGKFKEIRNWSEQMIVVITRCYDET